ncbi:hypothetical protein RNAN_2279 [Rheinheimera nanhaiensis E407-8]|uniref:Uncharacterized protein n=1 Tax=Rheinheimera nanhaiensis E407-8 TaxID=562729 RepID=I1DZ06_9GAMM|nr:hypothetical protein RNAN_2279 [Rheinheimera nanhaiensis E407-8]
MGQPDRTYRAFNLAKVKINEILELIAEKMSNNANLKNQVGDAEKYSCV